MPEREPEPLRKPESDSSPPAPAAPRARVDPLALATFLGVVAVLVISFASWRDVSRVERRLRDVEARVGQLGSGGPAQSGRRGPDPNRVYAVDTEGAPTRGRASAPVTIAEFSDFQCPYCARVGPTLRQIETTYGDEVRVVWKNLPLEMHRNAMGAHLAALAAGRQGKFWEFHDRLFANQHELTPDAYERHARELGLDVARFERDLGDPELRKRIDADKAEAQSLGVTGTPAFFVNGRFLSGAQPFEEFARTIDGELSRLGLPVPSGRPAS